MISQQTAEHFTWRDVCDGWYLVNQPDRLTVLQERMPPGSSEVRHLHRQAYQFFFILAGTATLEINTSASNRRPTSYEIGGMTIQASMTQQASLNEERIAHARFP